MKDELYLSNYGGSGLDPGSNHLQVWLVLVHLIGTPDSPQTASLSWNSHSVLFDSAYLLLLLKMILLLLHEDSQVGMKEEAHLGTAEEDKDAQNRTPGSTHLRQLAPQLAAEPPPNPVIAPPHSAASIQ